MTWMVPRPFMACAAFVNRLTSTWRNWSGSTSIASSAAPRPAGFTATVRRKLRTRRRRSRPARAARWACGRGGRLSRQVQQVVDGLVGARRPRSRCDPGAWPTFRPRVASAPRWLAQQEQRRFDHRQRVAQLVADAGGKLADGGQPAFASWFSMVGLRRDTGHATQTPCPPEAPPARARLRKAHVRVARPAHRRRMCAVRRPAAPDAAGTRVATYPA